MAILATEKVLTLDYWKPAHKLQVGDYVFDRKGNPVKITLVQEYRASECYEVTFLDQLTVRGDAKLRLPCADLKYTKRVASYKGVLKFRRPLKYITTKDLYVQPKERYLAVPTADPLKFPSQDLPIPPFVFGYWFMRRTSKKRMGVREQQYKYLAQRFKDNGYVPTKTSHKTKNLTYFAVTPVIEQQLAPLIPTQIPNNYLMGSVEQRVELLSGIISANPHWYRKERDNFFFTHRKKSVCQRVQCLAESLGSKTSLLFIPKYKNYKVNFKTRFKVLENYEPKPVKVYHSRRKIIGVTQIPAQLCVHIETDGEDGTFLVGEGFISCL